MPELPDAVDYLSSHDRLLTGKTLERSVVKNSLVLRTFDPTVEQACRKVLGFSRLLTGD